MLRGTLAPEGEAAVKALQDGARVAVLGGGPAGSFFAYFFLCLARRFGLGAQVDIYERKNFTDCGPAGCNHCGGIVSESLVQILATEGINIPRKVVQRGIESYVMHTDVGVVRIETPTHERRIAAMHRGAGPRGTEAEDPWGSFDAFLLGLACDGGAHLVPEPVKSVDFTGMRPVVATRSGKEEAYDLVVGALGVNTPSLAAFEGLDLGYRRPGVTKTHICEWLIGEERVKRYFGSSMHVFLLDIPRLKFAALIPKGRFVTMCMLGENIDKALVGEFLGRPEVKKCFPPDVDLTRGAACQCFPKINIHPAVRPFADRLVLIGDSAVTRLYKDGIGAAYMTAKAAATTAVFHGVSQADFERHYWPTCRRIDRDNAIGRLIFLFTRQVQRLAFSRRGILRMVEHEQGGQDVPGRMSLVLWDTFTGSAPYRDIFLRTLKPAFLGTLAWQTAKAIVSPGRHKENGE